MPQRCLLCPCSPCNGNSMLLLGLESSCDDTRAALVFTARCGRSRARGCCRTVVVGQNRNYMPLWRLFVPEIRSNDGPCGKLDLCVEKRPLAEADLSLADVDGVLAGTGGASAL